MTNYPIFGLVELVLFSRVEIHVWLGVLKANLWVYGGDILLRHLSGPFFTLEM